MSKDTRPVAGLLIFTGLVAVVGTAVLLTVLFLHPAYDLLDNLSTAGKTAWAVALAASVLSATYMHRRDT